MQHDGSNENRSWKREVGWTPVSKYQIQAVGVDNKRADVGRDIRA